MHMTDDQLTDPKYLERYANVYTLVRSIPDDGRFDINDFGRKAETECNTAACMAGHAGLHSWFRDRGFILRPSYAYAATPSLLTLSGANPIRLCTDFFGFNTVKFRGADLIGHLFDPDYYGEGTYSPSPSEAADALYDYMLYHWCRKEVVDATMKAEVCYSAEEVHKNTNNWLL